MIAPLLDPTAAAKAVTEVLTVGVAPDGLPDIRPLKGVWATVSPFEVAIGPAMLGGAPLRFTIRAGLETDLATIPWFGRPVFNPADSRIALGAIVHDGLLEAKWEERIAAGVFYAVLRQQGLEPWRAQIMAAAVTAASSNW